MWGVGRRRANALSTIPKIHHKRPNRRAPREMKIIVRAIRNAWEAVAVRNNERKPAVAIIIPPSELMTSRTKRGPVASVYGLKSVIRCHREDQGYGYSAERDQDAGDGCERRYADSCEPLPRRPCGSTARTATMEAAAING